VKQAAARYQAAFQKRSSSENWAISAAQETSLNQTLFQMERHMMSKEGLPGRPWFKHEIYAPGLYTGYGVKTIPGVREAIEQKNWPDVKPQIEKARAVLLEVAAQIDAATRFLEGQ
jgi:N-acetylated-alpha-linked acidic dipeptidase